MNVTLAFSKWLHHGCMLRNSIRCSARIQRPYSQSSGNTTSKGKGQRKIFSGVQPTGSMHIGNYLGAAKKWVDIQNEGEDVMISIVDLHSITLPQDPDILRKNILEMTATLLACGVNPEKSTLFLQSSVPSHAELCWILGCISTMARLSHLPQYKEKTEAMKEIPLGLFVYPVLQAADILLYKSTHVPVGVDQVQHLQMAQQIVKTFNHRFGKTFPHPVGIIGDDTSSRIKSLRDPSKKMSKSDADSKSRILLLDEPDLIRKKFRKAVTDFTPEVTYDPVSRPGVSNMINIHCLITNKIPEEVCEESEGINVGEYKYVVADAVSEIFTPIRERILQYLDDPAYLNDILRQGAQKANQIASRTIQEVHDKVGLGIPNIAQQIHLKQQSN